MRHLEILLAEDLATVRDNIEVERARTPAHATFAPRHAFDPMQLVEQLAGRELGLYRDHLIEKWTLLDWPERLRLFDVRRGHEQRARKRSDRGACVGKVAFAIAEIRAERDEGDVKHVA